MMLTVTTAAVIQFVPAPTVPPPPIQPIVAWMSQVGNLEKAHLVLLAPDTKAPLYAPDEFHEVLQIGGRKIPVALSRDGPPIPVPINGYAKVTYSFTLPDNAAGFAMLITDLSDTGGFSFKVSG